MAVARSSGSPDTFDARLRETLERAHVMAVPWFLMAGYAYEVLDRPILSDGAWDELCKFMLEHEDEIKGQHHHDHLIVWEDLKTGTASYIKEDYLPSITKSAAGRLVQELYENPALKRRKRK